ncbi:MAG TPA: four helix bundle protein [Gemmatimonadales bacterium]|nr:four helix bundle protein [Gemmatimonadales bacterium]
MGDYKKLRVWEAADRLVVAVYRETQGFPSSEHFGLRSQLRRAAVSVPSNIAEGCGRNTLPQLRQYTRFALGSANEVEYQLGLAARLGFLDTVVSDRLVAEVVEVKRMLAGLLHGKGRH